MLGQEFEDVLSAARAGAGWACARLHRDLAGVVTGYLRQQGARDPDDVASETFLDVFRSLGSFEGDEQGFRAWVFTIAHRRLQDERRWWSRRPSTSSLDDMVHDPPAETPTPTAAGPSDLDPEFARPLHALPRAQRDVVLLRVVAGLSVAETAEATGHTRGAVRQLQRRGLKGLERSLGADPR